MQMIGQQTYRIYDKWMLVLDAFPNAPQDIP